MINLYFVLGYLGSGKTTFVINFLKKNKTKINALLINDFGKSNIDGENLSQYAKKQKK